MPLAADRVKDSTVNPSNTLVITLANSPATGYVAFYPSLNIGDRILYAIASTTSAQWETGYGQLITATTLERTSVTGNSSGTTDWITFSAGTYDVINTITAARHIDLSTRGKMTAQVSGMAMP